MYTKVMVKIIIKIKINYNYIRPFTVSMSKISCLNHKATTIVFPNPDVTLV